MMVVDSQIHPWREGLSTGHHCRAPLDEAALRQAMARAGVDRAVLVPPLWDPHGNRYALSLAAAEPDRFCVMGLLDPTAADAPLRLQSWTAEPGMRGVRFLFNTPERSVPLENGRMDELWPIAEAMGIPVAVLMPGRLAAIAGIARRHPHLRILVDHLGVPRGAVGDLAFQHLPQLLQLAEHANVSVKAAGVGDYARDPYPFRSLDAPLQAIFEAFGTERVIWGSDLSRLRHPYADCVDHFKHQLAFLSPPEVARVMGGNINTLLGWS